jgi:hypothetical protein
VIVFQPKLFLFFNDLEISLDFGVIHLPLVIMLNFEHDETKQNLLLFSSSHMVFNNSSLFM